jgi:hypothetical protein
MGNGSPISGVAGPSKFVAGPGPPTAADLMLACAADTELFARTFFPKTMRQRSPKAHEEVWKALDDPKIRYLNLNMCRGFGKTTISRIFLAKRFAYALSHTVLYIGSSEDKASQSVLWLRSRIASRDPASGKLIPTPFARFFNLRPGAKWSETELEIYHGFDTRPIWFLGLGMTSDGVRGINFDDYRPDLIYCDDILTDENASTKVQRNKLNDLLFGAVRESLSPVVDEPNAKMVLDQTPHARGDISDLAEYDPSFHTIKVPCWTKETLDLPTDMQVSAWEERYPTATLRTEKEHSIVANRYSIFARERECRLVTKENADFKMEWLKYREGKAVPMYCVLSIDPVPPPSEAQLERNLLDKDFECQMVVGRHKGEYHVIDYVTNRGHEPNWSVNTAFMLAMRYRVSKIIVETVAYQRTLKWLIEKEMARRGIYYMIGDYKDKRPKPRRIPDTLAGVASQGRLWIERNMTELMLQWETYPLVDHDDVLDALSMGMSAIVNPYLELESRQVEDLDEDYEEFEFKRAAP